MANRSHVDGAIDRLRAKSRMISTAGLFKEALSQWLEDNCLRLSAAVSFYAVLSLAPLLSFLFPLLLFLLPLLLLLLLFRL